MSNLKSAKQAIEAELEHARQGLDFYQSRVAALEETLFKIQSVDSAPSRSSSTEAGEKLKARRGRKAKARAKSSEQNAGVEDKLPSTGKDFWPRLITGEPKSAAEILDAAIRALGITPTTDQLKKLSQRQANALSILSKNGEITSSGSGRARRFFRNS